MGARARRLLYLDLVWTDTPIADESVEKRLRYMAQEVNMSKRFERTKLFLDYLAKMEEIDFEENPQYYESDLGKHKFMDQIIRGFEKDVRYVEARGLERNN